MRNSSELLSTFSLDVPVKDSWEFPQIPMGNIPEIFLGISARLLPGKYSILTITVRIRKLWNRLKL